MVHLVRPGLVHRLCYTDSDLFEREMRDLFGGVWTYLGHESQIREPGDFVTTTLGRRPVLLCRSDDGQVRALLNRCMHRAVVVCTEPCGRAARFTCPYHGWTYANDGRLAAVPFAAEYGPDFDKAERSLRPVTHVDSRSGFLFGSMREDPPPLEDWLGPAASWIDFFADRAPDGALSLSPVPLRVRFAGNWKLVWDNAADGLHATFAHRSYNDLGHQRDRHTVLARDPARTPMYASALGHGHQVVDQRPDLHNGFWASQRPVPHSDVLTAALRERVGAERAGEWLELATGAMVNLSVFPNLIFVGNQLMVVEPLSVGETRLTLWLMVSPRHPDEVDSLRLRVEEDFTNFGTPDDLAMFERAQQGLAVEEVEWVDISRGVHLDDERRGSDGVVTGPITSEAPARGFWDAWVAALDGHPSEG